MALDDTTSALGPPRRRERIPIEIGPNTGPFVNGWQGELVEGVTVFVADTGTGKSTLMRFLINLFGAGKMMRNAITVYDRAASAVAELVFGSARVTCRRGERPEIEGGAELPPVEGLPSLITLLVTGKHRDGEDAAFRERLNAICAWTGIGVDKALKSALLGEDQQIRRIGVEADDVADAVKEIRAGIHELRRAQEAIEKRLRGEYDTLFGQRTAALDGFAESAVRDTIPAISSARTRESSARDALGAARGARSTGLAAEERLRQQVAAQPERPDVAAAEQKVRDAESNRLATANLVDEQLQAVELLRKQLAGAEAVLASRRAEMRGAEYSTSQAEQALAGAREAARQWDVARLELDRGLSFPSQAEIASLEAAHARAAEAVRLNEAATKYDRLTLDLEAKTAEMKKVAARIAELQDEAAAVWRRLAAEIGDRLGPDSEIRIAEVMREKKGKEPEPAQIVEILVDGEWRDISDDEKVSEGNRVAVAFKLLLEKRRERRVIMISGSTPLGPSRCSELGRLAIAHHLFIGMETAQGARPGEMYCKHYPSLEEMP